jgi:hypothetical protein
MAPFEILEQAASSHQTDHQEMIRGTVIAIGSDLGRKASRDLLGLAQVR